MTNKFVRKLTRKWNERDCPECSKFALLNVDKNGNIVDELKCFTCNGTGTVSIMKRLKYLCIKIVQC